MLVMSVYNILLLDTILKSLKIALKLKYRKKNVT